MKVTYSSVVLLTLVFVTSAGAGKLVDLTPPYKSVDIVMYLNDPKVKNELKITKKQEAAVEAIWTKLRGKFFQDNDKLLKMSGPDKDAKIRALTAARADELFKSLGQALTPGQVQRLKQILLQHWGVMALEHPEIRSALKIGDEQLATLKSIEEEICRELIADVRGGRISQQEAEKRYNKLSHTVPERVRAALTKEQRKKLHELLGEPYNFQ
jgi:hypothetical protein